MGNLRVAVDNAADQTEARNIMISLGYLPKEITCISGGDLGFVVNAYNENGATYKEITLPQLRDLVVLKRNDRKDATHKCETSAQRLGYLASGGIEYIWSYGNSIWFKPKEMNFKSFNIKPIEKTEMKEPKQAEFLVKTDSGYVLQVLDENAGGADVVRVPDGADTFAGDDNCHYFWQHRSGKKHLLIGCGSSLERYTQWVECEDSADEWLSNFDGDNSLRILWQREISTEEFKSKLPESTFKDFKQPEDLPFVDDKCYTNKSNGVFKLLKDKPCDISKWSELRGESLNDQYAEIEKVRQSHRTASETADPTIKETLSQRQEQYGSFEDVAMITEQMVDVMRKGYYENLSYNQKMALYMICSKMARIVNGNPNHKDSWHDIAGYATLIDNELVSEKDMPF